MLRGLLIAAVLMLPGGGGATDARAQAPDKPGAAAAPSAAAEYERKLAAYAQARQKFDEEAAAYWARWCRSGACEMPDVASTKKSGSRTTC
jgi:putative hemolysin